MKIAIFTDSFLPNINGVVTSVVNWPNVRCHYKIHKLGIIKRLIETKDMVKSIFKVFPI